MRRILFQCCGVAVCSFPAMLYLGMVIGMFAGNYAAHLARVDPSRIFVATLILLIPALVGARLFHIALNWRIYSKAPNLTWRRSTGGASLYGGLPFALLISGPVLNALRIPLGTFWDIATFTILIAMIFARVGCLLNGCCAGRPSEGWFAVYLPDHCGVWRRRMPTQILEAILAFALLIFAIVTWNWRAFPGSVFLYAMAGYGLGRLVLEATREDQAIVRGISVNHLISATLVTISATLLAVAWPR